MIGIREGSLVELSLGLPLGSTPDSPNPGSEMPNTLLGVLIGSWFGSDVVWVVVIYYVPTSGYFITYKIKSVRYCQLMELTTLSLSPTWLIPTSGGI